VVRDLAVWCQDNNLSLNVSKTKELIVYYRKRWAEQSPINIDRAVVEWVESFKFLQIHQDCCEEGTTKPFVPQETEKIWHRSPDPKKFYSCIREHPDRLHHRLVWQLLGI
jgi:hypothetical protein